MIQSTYEILILLILLSKAHCQDDQKRRDSLPVSCVCRQWLEI